MLGSYQRIMIILENEDLSKAYALILKGQGHCVQVERTFENACRSINKFNPTLIISDPFTTDEGPVGLPFLKASREQFPRVQILVLTERYSEQIIANAFRAGASGFILFNKGVEEVVRAVHDISTGGAPMSKEVAACLVQSYQITIDNPLTRREQDVLREVSTGKTYQYIAQELHVSVDTVRTHVKHIFDKLDVRNKSEAVIKARSQRLV